MTSFYIIIEHKDRTATLIAEAKLVTEYDTYIQIDDKRYSRTTIDRVYVMHPLTSKLVWEIGRVHAPK